MSKNVEPCNYIETMKSSSHADSIDSLALYHPLLQADPEGFVRTEVIYIIIFRSANNGTCMYKSP